MVVLQDERQRLDAGARVEFGFAGLLRPDHPYATTQADLAHFDALCELPEARAPLARALDAPPTAMSLFARAPFLEARDLDGGEIDAVFGLERRHEEREDGQLLSFFVDGERHIVLRAKELRVQRPHGALLRTGAALTPTPRNAALDSLRLIRLWAP